MKDISGVVKVVEWIDSDVKETNIQIDHQTKELKQLESRFENLTDRLAFLEQANIEKEGQIDYLEGVIQLMSDKLCRCGDRKVSSVSVEAGMEEPMVEEAEGSQLEYTKDDEYHTPEIEEVPLPVRELRLIESPLVEWLVNPFSEDECCRPRHPGVGWRSAGPSPVLRLDPTGSGCTEGRDEDRVQRTAIDCPHQNACRKSKCENRGD